MNKADINCPHCGHSHDIWDYPDHWMELGDGDIFKFECDSCKKEFDVVTFLVREFEPVKQALNPAPDGGK